MSRFGKGVENEPSNMPAEFYGKEKEMRGKKRHDRKSKRHGKRHGRRKGSR